MAKHAARRERSTKLRAWGLAAAMVVLTAAVPVLSYVGFNAVLSSRAGRSLDPVNDPAKPGYEANVAPTPVELVASVDTDGALSGLTVLALGGNDEGGGVLFVPVGTVIDGTGAELAETLGATFARGGAVALGPAASAVLGFGFDELTVLDDARWSELVQPVAPLTFDNPDRVRAPAFPAGAIELEAEQVGPYLAARNAGESDLARLARHEAFWRAWLRAIAASSLPGAVPGDRFGYATTVVRFTDEAQRPAADAMVKALGLGAMEQVEVVDDVVELTIVIGMDSPPSTVSPARRQLPQRPPQGM